MTSSTIPHTAEQLSLLPAPTVPLRFRLDEATRREFVYTHKWRQGDAVMWDNRAMLHRGRPWDYKKERSMVRTTISATDADGLAEVRPPMLH